MTNKSTSNSNKKDQNNDNPSKLEIEFSLFGAKFAGKTKVRFFSERTEKDSDSGHLKD